MSDYPEKAELPEKIEPDNETQTGNSFGRGLAVLFRHAGCDTDYPTVMGDIGQAFATQGVDYAEDLTGGYADVGWWPLDLFQMENRLPFLSSVYGCVIDSQLADFPDVASDPEAYYRDHFEQEVRSQIAAGRPLLSIWHAGFIVTGYDQGTPPLLGWCLAAGKAEKMRADDYPRAIYTCGEKRSPMDRHEADRQALLHAVALGRGTSPSPTKGQWVTGPRAWKGWEHHLIERKSDTHHYWHANQRKQIVAWRRCAVTYLQAMQERHTDAVSALLAEAVDLYQKQIARLSDMQISHESIVNPGTGRESLAGLIREAAALDGRAIDAIDEALARLQ